MPVVIGGMEIFQVLSLDGNVIKPECIPSRPCQGHVPSNGTDSSLGRPFMALQTKQIGNLPSIRWTRGLSGGLGHGTAAQAPMYRSTGVHCLQLGPMNWPFCTGEATQTVGKFQITSIMLPIIIDTHNFTQLGSQWASKWLQKPDL